MNFDLNNNQFLSGGLVLMIIGGFLAYFRTLPIKIYSLFERFFILKIDIQDDDESHQWMKVWLSKRLEKTLSISVLSRKKGEQENYYEDEEDNPRINKPLVYFFVPNLLPFQEVYSTHLYST